MKSPDIHISTLSQASYANRVKIRNQNHIHGQNQVDLRIGQKKIPQVVYFGGANDSLNNV